MDMERTSMESEHYPFEPLAFLLVEDSPSEVFALAETFNTARIYNKLMVLRRGMDVLPFLRREPPFESKRRPDAIFLKLPLRDVDGGKLLEEIRADTRISGLPVIVIIDGPTTDVMEETFGLDAELVLHKPINPNRLRSALLSLEGRWITFLKETANGEAAAPLPAEIAVPAGSVSS